MKWNFCELSTIDKSGKVFLHFTLCFIIMHYRGYVPKQQDGQNNRDIFR